MVNMAHAIPTVELTLDDLNAFPDRTRERIVVAEGQGRPPAQWLLVGTRSRRQGVVMRRVLETVERIAEQRRDALTESRIEALVDLYLEDEGRTDFDREIERDNAKLRAQYLMETRTWTASDIHEYVHGRKLANPSEPASRWRREGKVFAVRSGRVRLFPRFQFADGRPRPVVGEILKRLPDDMTSWQIAFWFEGGNGWLDGRAPEDALDDRDNILMAADRSREMHAG